MTLEQPVLIEMYRRMRRIREFELAAIDLFKRGQVKGAIHACIGQEAAEVGVCMALRRDDVIAGTHRSHGHNLAKGADPARMMAEILGKATGYCKGRGGSMHIAAFETGSLGALAVVGSGIPLAVGAALAFKMRGEDRVAVPFTGDAGCNTGNWHEGLNLAAIWSLPVVFVLENNHYGVSTNIKDAARMCDLSLRAQAYGIPGVRVDGFDGPAVYRAAAEAVTRARLRPGAHPSGDGMLSLRGALRGRTGGLSEPRRSCRMAPKRPAPAVSRIPGRQRDGPGGYPRPDRRGGQGRDRRRGRIRKGEPRARSRAQPWITSTREGAHGWPKKTLFL